MIVILYCHRCEDYCIWLWYCTVIGVRIIVYDCDIVLLCVRIIVYDCDIVLLYVWGLLHMIVILYCYLCVWGLLYMIVILYCYVWGLLYMIVILYCCVWGLLYMIVILYCYVCEDYCIWLWYCTVIGVRIIAYDCGIVLLYVWGLLYMIVILYCYMCEDYCIWLWYCIVIYVCEDYCIWLWYCIVICVRIIVYDCDIVLLIGVRIIVYDCGISAYGYKLCEDWKCILIVILYCHMCEDYCNTMIATNQMILLSCMCTGLLHMHCDIDIVTHVWGLCAYDCESLL